MENQSNTSQSKTNIPNSNVQTNNKQTKIIKLIVKIIVWIVVLTVVLNVISIILKIYVDGEIKKLMSMGYNTQISKNSTDDVSGIDSKSTLPTDSAETTYTYGTFSISYPKKWQVYDSKTNKAFFTKYNLIGFDHLVALQNGANYLVIGIDTKMTKSEVGGIFVTEADQKEFFSRRTELTINGEKYLLLKSDTSLNTLTDPDGEAGIASIASLSKYIPNKVTTDNNQTFNGYENYIKTKNGSGYMVIKLSIKGYEVTTATTQAEYINVLESIRW